MENYIAMTTLVSAIFGGVFLFIVARYIRVPAIVLLLVGGIVLGPEFIGIVDPQSLGEGLRMIISLAVAVILFEGGLTLDRSGMSKAPVVIWRLLTFGVIITWLGTSLIIYYAMDYSFSFSLLAGSLVIVTGPTVIAPLLKRIRINEKMFHVLHWEGVLIDPIGVFIAVLCYEWYVIDGDTTVQLIHLSYRLAIGLIFGLGGGYLLKAALEKEIVPTDYSNIFVFGSTIFLFTLSDIIMHEAGILTVIIAGFVVGQIKGSKVKHLHKFKSELTELSIAIVFILLAASLKISDFLSIGWGGFLIIPGVLLIVRPLSIIVCSFGTNLTFKEKLFLSWIAPRGVIAGSMASLFGLELMTKGFPNAEFLETFTFSIIAATIILQGLSAGWVARMLGVVAPEKTGWLIAGASPLASKMAEFINTQTGSNCTIIDTNSNALSDISGEGITVFQGNALEIDSLPTELLMVTGHVLALTDNPELNVMICKEWGEQVNSENLFRWEPSKFNAVRAEVSIGTPIWNTLPRPSQITYEIKNRHLLFHESGEQLDSRRLQLTTTLATFENDSISFSGSPSGPSPVLLLERTKQHLVSMLQPSHIETVAPVPYEEHMRNSLKKLVQLHPGLDYDTLIEELLQREGSYPTILDNGVAAPNMRCTNITQPLCYVSVVKSDTPLKDDDCQLRLLFLLVSPKESQVLHLNLLSDIAKVSLNPRLIGKIEGYSVEEDVIFFMREILKNEAPKYV
ncbi:MAG: cation:proton antiporter [Fibrobacterales bacterium]